MYDFQPAQEWLRSRRAVDPDPALDLWNLAIDMAHSLDLPFRQRGITADRCHEKLTVPTDPGPTPPNAENRDDVVDLRRAEPPPDSGAPPMTPLRVVGAVSTTSRHGA